MQQLQQTYGATFTLDGTTIDPMPDNALIAVNGVTAMIATTPSIARTTSRAFGTFRR